MKKTLAIVSSFSESCGNAAFTEVLRESICQYSPAAVEVIELNLPLLQSVDRRFRRAGDRHIREICERLGKFDAVNVQFEAGLYGTLPRDICRRMRAIISSNKNTSITFHSPRLAATSQSDARAGIKMLASFRIVAGARQILGGLLGSANVRLNRAVLKAAMRNRCRLIVHTGRAREQMRLLYGYENVDVHPLRLVREEFAPVQNFMQRIREELKLTPTDKTIGLFGYISAYKGHHDALDALALLPSNYKLLIFGRQHPQTIRTDGTVDAYLLRLMSAVEKSELAERVFFMGELRHQEFLSAAATVDIAWLPYYENGQDGSGIASICLDLAPYVVCSASFAFDELLRLLPYENCVRFDIGNAMELASKTLTARVAPRTQVGERPYNLRSQALTYVKEVS